MGGWISWKYSHLSPAKAEARAELGNNARTARKFFEGENDSSMGENIMCRRAINWLYVVNMEISMVKTKVGCYGNQILALQPCGGNPYGA